MMAMHLEMMMDYYSDYHLATQMGWRMVMYLVLMMHALREMKLVWLLALHLVEMMLYQIEMHLVVLMDSN